jgi:HK97 family phage major capsid protein
MTTEQIQRLLETRANVWEQAKAHLDTVESEKRELTGEAKDTWDRFNADLADLDARVKELTDLEERNTRAEEARAKYGEIKPAADDERSKLEGELRAMLKGERRSVDIKPEKRIDFNALRPSEKRANVVGTNTAGGYTVPTDFYPNLIEHMILVSGLLSAGPTVLQTASGEPIQVPKTTAHSTAALIAEGAAIGESDPTFGQITLNSYKYGLLLQVSTELVDDSGVDLLGYLAREAGRATGNAFGADGILGNGTAKPTGVTTVSTLGVTGSTGVGGTLTFDNVIDLFYSVISPYRASPEAAWLLNDTTAGVIRKLKDSQNRYLWEPSLVAGAPDLILGKPVYTDPNIATVALSAKSLLFGDWSRYFVRMVNGVRFERSDDYAFNADLITFRCLIRADGNLIDRTGAIKHFVGGAT